MAVIPGSSSPAVGVIGLGAMGTGMAGSLLRAGFPVTVWNRTRSKTGPMVAAGAKAAADPASVARTSGIVVLSVSDTADVEAVIFGADGVAQGARPGTVVVDTSTISPDATRGFAKRLRDGGIDLIDAPVSGGPEGAAKGTLSIMAGGSSEALARAMPVLAALGATVTHIGESGSGQIAKLVNQILVAVNTLAMSEALLFAQACGVDLQRTWEAVTKGAGGSWMLQVRGPQILKRDFAPGFAIDLQQKDLRLVLAAADAHETPVAATALVFQLYRTLQAQGGGGWGNHALIRALEQLSGITVGIPGTGPGPAPTAPG